MLADPYGMAERLARRRGGGVGPREDRGERLSADNPVAWLYRDQEADCRVDDIRDIRPAAAERGNSPPDLPRLDFLDDALGRRLPDPGYRRLGKHRRVLDDGRVAALRLDDAREELERGTRGDDAVELHPGRRRV